MPIAFLQVITDNPWIIQLSVFGLIAAVAWLAVDWIGAGSSRAEQRLQDFKDPMSRKRREAEGGPGKKKSDAMARLAAWAETAFGSLDASSSESHSFELQVFRYKRVAARCQA